MRGQRRCRRRDRAFVAQHRQPPSERGPVAGLDRLPPGSVPEVPLDDLFIEVGQRTATTRNPTQESADHIETSPSAMANEAVLHETHREALDKRTVLPAPETPEQPASAQILFDFHLPVLRC